MQMGVVGGNGDDDDDFSLPFLENGGSYQILSTLNPKQLWSTKAWECFIKRSQANISVFWTVVVFLTEVLEME